VFEHFNIKFDLYIIFIIYIINIKYIFNNYLDLSLLINLLDQFEIQLILFLLFPTLIRLILGAFIHFFTFLFKPLKGRLEFFDKFI